MIIDIVNYSLVIPQLCPLDKLLSIHFQEHIERSRDALDKLFVSSPSADLDTIPPIEWSP